MSELCSYISKAEKCFLQLSKQRVNDVTFGFDQDESRNNLMLMSGLIGALERFKCGESCLTDEDIMNIYEKIDKLCSVCNCNC